GERAIRDLLAAAGRRPGGSHVRVKAQRAARGLRTPETYLGAAKAQAFVGGPLSPGSESFRDTPSRLLPPNQFSYGGLWKITGESATARQKASLELNFDARRVFLVLGSPAGPRNVRVLLDGRPISDRFAGADVHGGVATISRQRLYRLVDLPRVEQHVLTLRFAPGISGYAFTFG